MTANNRPPTGSAKPLHRSSRADGPPDPGGRMTADGIGAIAPEKAGERPALASAAAATPPPLPALEVLTPEEVLLPARTVVSAPLGQPPPRIRAWFDAE